MTKKLLATLCTVFAVTTSVFACWFTESDFKTNYIASINGTAIHSNVGSNEVIYVNGSKVRSVGLPMTVMIKVAERSGKDSTLNPIIKAVLQYKIVKFSNGQVISETPFRTVRILDNPKWNMSFKAPVNLFGKSGTINIDNKEISNGDGIIVRLYLSDGLYQTGDLDGDITWNEIPEECSISKNNISIGMFGWTAPYVFKVIYNGKKRLVI